ncbi:hypothetical protein SK128_026007, partial [Halocaridina rubra]
EDSLRQRTTQVTSDKRNLVSSVIPPQEVQQANPMMHLVAALIIALVGFILGKFIL